MENLFAFLVLASFILFGIGIISPKTSLFWDKQAPSRKKSALIYGGLWLVFLFAFGSMVDDKKVKAKTGDTAVASAETAVKPMSEADKKKMVADSLAAAKVAAAQAEKEIADQTMSAQQLINQYKANEVKADQNFKGKTFYVAGTVSEIKKDILDHVYVSLDGDEMLEGVQCYFDDEQTASNLNKGQSVLFKGTCDGLMMYVQMKHCEQIK